MALTRILCWLGWHDEDRVVTDSFGRPVEITLCRECNKVLERRELWPR